MSNTGFKETLLRDLECYTRGEQPSPLLLLGAPVIEDWSTEVRPLGKEFKMVVTGRAEGHPEYADGDMISTAAVVWFDRKCRWCRTVNRVYRLGEHAGDPVPLGGVDA